MVIKKKLIKIKGVKFMKKDLDKLLSRTLFTYFSILFVIFVLKLFGLDYFGLDTNNKIIININNFVSHWRLQNIWYTITLYFNTFIVLAITCNDNSKRMKIFVIFSMVINVIIGVIEKVFDGHPIFVLVDLLYLFILSICYIIFVKKEKVHKHNVGNYWLLMILSTIFQLISLITRNAKIKMNGDFVITTLLSFDYLILLLMVYKLYFIKGGISLCKMVLGYSSDLLISLKMLPQKLLKSYQSSKPKSTQDKLADRIYLAFFWLYNIFTVIVILFIATLNDTFIECIFILSSFWINKGVFGKAFHLKKASTCFMVSSLSYYVLNRLTWNIGISFLIPIVLGISLSYITSKFMAMKENLYLHKGMSEESFYKLITKVTSNQEHIKICKMYYVDKESNVKIAMRFNYSEINIKKIKQNINNKIKELYK